jgi:hypothetical protein
MNKTKIANTTKAILAKNGPAILTGLAAGGLILDVVLTAKASTKAEKLLEERRKKQNVDKLTFKETIKTVWKPYLPVIITTGATLTCMILSCTEQNRKNAALLAAYKLSETAFSEYKSQVIENIGEKKEQAILEETAKKSIISNPVSTAQQIYMTGNGNYLCQESYTKRYFRSDIDSIKSAFLELNTELCNEGIVSLNYLFEALGLPECDAGNDVGWKKDGIGDRVELLTTYEGSELGEPCLVIGYLKQPKYLYNFYM